ncbi:hypothetical protein NM688_g5819 [Phlebia brevispora]|uniref:Uncharacterized protein n=1 Tax=Phlebia brevispora TaxID=194682 RepID=A0ACC1SPK2_9APHY|nr:hypothetical protein NM688_g5819 [Phlebia brevispora]
MDSNTRLIYWSSPASVLQTPWYVRSLCTTGTRAEQSVDTAAGPEHSFVQIAKPTHSNHHMAFSEQAVPVDGCFAVTCDKCGKTTWKGCGKHVEQVMANVKEEDRCTCPRS